MGTLFSLTPPLLEAVDDIKRMIGKYRKPRQRAAAGEGDGRSREMVLSGLAARQTQTSANGASSGESDASKH